MNPIKSLPLSALFALFVAIPVFAQFQHNTDYYFDRSDAWLKEQLKAVELYHMELCEKGIVTRRYDSASADCIFMLNYFPNHPRALMTLASMCQAWKGPKCDMSQYFDSAIAVNPNAAATYITVGISQLRAQHVPEAIKSLSKAAELAPGSVNAHYNLALAYLDTKEYSLANEHAQQAYALGAPLPGLRDKLQRLGHWVPLASPAPENPSEQSAPPPSTQP